MTLIGLYNKPYYFAVSDALLSTDEQALGRTISLPLTGRISPVRRARNYSMAQKTVIIDRSQLIMWSGDYSKARSIITQYYDDVRLCGVTSFESFLNKNFNPDETSGLSFIHTFIDRFGGKLITGINVFENQVGSRSLRAAGSGRMDFFDTTNVNPMLGNGKELDLNYEVACRILFSMTSESFAFFSEDPSAIVQARYGGWWELTYCDRSGFGKTPYLVKYWTIENGKLKGLRGWQSWYEDHNLKITVFGANGSNNQRTVYHVPDFLERDVVSDNMQPLQGADFHIHILMTHDNQMRGHIMPKGYQVSFGNDGFTEELTDEFVDTILNLDPEAAGGRISRK